MKIYFLSSRPCALTVGGAYFGVTDTFERFAELSLKDNLYAQFSPQGALPIGVFLTEKLRTKPPENCEVYLLKDGAAIYAKDFPPADFTLRIVAQERFGESLVTVFRQGVLQLSLETPLGFFSDRLPECFSDCAVTYGNGLFFLDGGGALAVYNERGERVFFERVRSWRTENETLYAVLPLSDRLGRSAETEYALSREGIRRTAFRIEQKGERSAIDGLIAYAFFESVLIGANFAALLSDELQPRADDIRAFLGEFAAVLPTDNANVCRLVRRKKERLFEVVDAAVSVENGKITDVRV